MSRTRIEYRDSPAQVLRRAVDAVRLGTEAAVEEWHREIMPDHFTVAGGKRYAYKARKGDGEPPRVLRTKGKLASRTVSNPRYSWQKRRRMGHNRPLVWTGASEDAAKSAVKVSSRRKKGAPGVVEASAAMPNLPKYFYQRRKDYDAPDKPAELTRALPDEERRLAVTVERVAMHRLLQARQERAVVQA